MQEIDPRTVPVHQQSQVAKDQRAADPCRFCAVAKQILINLALGVDIWGNVLLLGNNRETISKRSARARVAGHKWAVYFCAFLTWAFNTLFHMGRDHCTWSLSTSTKSVSAEIWHWSKPDLSDVDNI